MSLNFARPLLALILAAASLHAAAAPVGGRVFGPGTPFFEADLGQRSEADRQSIELWLQPAAGAQDGAVIVDKLSPATGYGIRLEMTGAGRVRMIVNGGRRLETASVLPTDRPSHLLAAFDAREKTVALYVDGRLDASLPVDPKRKIEAAGVYSPLRVGADLSGTHRFAGTIAYLAVHPRAATAVNAARLFAASGPAPDAVDAWHMAKGADGRIASALGRTALATPSTISALSTAPANALTLWYPRPAREWLESLPSAMAAWAAPCSAASNANASS